jgi:hypothetical protein
VPPRVRLVASPAAPVVASERVTRSMSSASKRAREVSLTLAVYSPLTFETSSPVPPPSPSSLDDILDADNSWRTEVPRGEFLLQLQASPPSSDVFASPIHS